MPEKEHKLIEPSTQHALGSMDMPACCAVIEAERDTGRNVIMDDLSMISADELIVMKDSIEGVRNFKESATYRGDLVQPVDKSQHFRPVPHPLDHPGEEHFNWHTGISMIVVNEGIWRFMQTLAAFFVHWRKFDYLMGLVIFANAVCIGVELELELPCIDAEIKGRGIEQCEHRLVFSYLEKTFVSIYILELVLRFVAGARIAIKNKWVWFDIFLVCLGATSTFILPAIKDASHPDLNLDQFLVARMLRLARLARALRLIHSCKNLWKLVQGLLKSFSTMASVCTVLVVVIYIFACMGVELIRKDENMLGDAMIGDMVLYHFGTLPKTMLTLMQFYTMDSIANVYFPLIDFKPTLAVYFGGVFVVVSISLMNMVTALIVNSALETARDDLEMEAEQMRSTLHRIDPLIHQMFEELDKTGDGSITIKEVQEAVQNNGLQFPYEIRTRIAEDKLVELFAVLDSDGSGELSADEFKEGIHHLVLSTVPIEVTQTLQMLKAIIRAQKDNQDDAASLRGRLDSFLDVHV